MIQHAEIAKASRIEQPTNANFDEVQAGPEQTHARGKQFSMLNLGASSPESIGLASATTLLALDTNSQRDIQSQMNTKPGPPAPDNPGVKPDSPNLAPTVRNGQALYNPLALPGEAPVSGAPTQNVDAHSGKLPDGASFALTEGQLKDGTNTKFSSTEIDGPNGDLSSRTVSYSPPNTLTIKDDSGGSRTIDVANVRTYFDLNRGRYVSIITDSNGQQTAWSTSRDGKSTVPYGQVA